MGIALLRIVDSKSESKTLDDYALAYIPIAPVEILLVTFAPLFVLNQHGWSFILLTLATSIVIIGMALKNGWLQLK